MPRPLQALLLVAIFTIVAGITWAAAYVRNRMAALAYVESLDGYVETETPAWSRGWGEVPNWFQSVTWVAVKERPVTSLRPLVALHELSALYCPHADFDDGELQQLRNLRNLDTLVLAQGHFSDVGLAEVRHCARLTNLTVASPRITDAGLRPLRNLKLRSLVVKSPGITDAGMADLVAMAEHAPFLGLIDAQVTDAGLKHLAGLPIEWLALRGTRITNDGLRDLSGLKLASLNICDTRISDEGLVYLEGMPLRSLMLGNTRITDAGLRHLAGLPLITLDLSGTQITDAGLQELPTWDKMHELDLTETEVTCDGLLSAHGTRSLRTVKLSAARFTPEDGRRLKEAGIGVELVNPAEDSPWWDAY